MLTRNLFDSIVSSPSLFFIKSWALFSVEKEPMITLNKYDFSKVESFFRWLGIISDLIVFPFDVGLVVFFVWATTFKIVKSYNK